MGDNPDITWDMPHNPCSFDFLKLFLVGGFFQTMVNKANEYAEEVIAASRSYRLQSILNLWVFVTVK